MIKLGDLQGLPKRKETKSHKIKPLPEYNEGWIRGFNQCKSEYDNLSIKVDKTKLLRMIKDYLYAEADVLDDDVVDAIASNLKSILKVNSAA